MSIQISVSNDPVYNSTIESIKNKILEFRHGVGMMPNVIITPAMPRLNKDIRESIHDRLSKKYTVVPSYDCNDYTPAYVSDIHIGGVKPLPEDEIPF